MKKKLFEDWLANNTDLAENTKKNYISSVSSISTWSNIELETSYDLYKESNSKDIYNLVEKIEKMPDFNIKNENSHNSWSSALKFYKQFLKSQSNMNENPLITQIKETCEKSLSDKNFLPIEELQSGYDLFYKKFNPKILQNLDGEELIEAIFYIGNKDGLTYWLEFKNDDEFKTNDTTYGSIAGGSSFKYIMFKRNSDNKWVTGNPKKPTVLTIDEAIDLGRELRDSLVAGAKLIEQLSENATIDEYIELQSKFEKLLVRNMYSLGWVHKYYHMLYPDKIDAYHNTNWHKHILICFNIKPIAEDKMYILSGQLMQIVKNTELPSSYVMNSMCSIFKAPVNYYRIGINNKNNNSWQDMLNNSYIGIDLNELGDLRKYDTDNNMKKNILKKLVETDNMDKNIANKKSGEIIRFYKHMKNGDIVVAMDGKTVLGVGIVLDEYEYVEDRTCGNCRKVEWKSAFADLKILPNSNEGNLTLCNCYKNIENIVEIRKLLNLNENNPNNPNDIVIAKVKKALDPLSGKLAEIKAVLNRKKQVILYGPPGTGKTYHAEKVCNELAARNLFTKSFDDLDEKEKELVIGNGRNSGVVRMCCFHPSYGYEDFIEGIKPKIINNQTVFELTDGIFKILCEDAKINPEKEFYLIIDEINRGDISRIFGELIMLIESSKRGKKLILPLSNRPFEVPENVYIVGTMNTADRSIALLDVALRRRFGFIELMPDYKLFSNQVFEGLPLASWLQNLNGRICEHIGKDARNLQIGHSYFLEKEEVISSSTTFIKIIKEDIIPLIEEYCYGDYSLISKILGDGIVDVKNQSIRFELIDSLDESNFIGKLLSACPTIRVDSDLIDDEQDHSDNDLGNE